MGEWYRNSDLGRSAYLDFIDIEQFSVANKGVTVQACKVEHSFISLSGITSWILADWDYKSLGQ